MGRPASRAVLGGWFVVVQMQSPEVPGPGGGPGSGGPDQTSRRPQNRSTLTASPLAPELPLASGVVCQTSPALTVIDESTRPLGDRVSTSHGRPGSSALIGFSYPPAATTSITFWLTTRVTAIVVWLAMLSVMPVPLTDGVALEGLEPALPQPTQPPSTAVRTTAANKRFGSQFMVSPPSSTDPRTLRRSGPLGQRACVISTDQRVTRTKRLRAAPASLAPQAVSSAAARP